MADTSIPPDIIAGVAEALEEVGKTMTLRQFTKGALDPSDAGAGRPLTPSDSTGKVFLYEYSDRSINGTSILKGDRVALFDLNSFSPAKPAKGDLLIEDSTTTYKIVDLDYTEVQGTKVVCLAQVRK